MAHWTQKTFPLRSDHCSPRSASMIWPTIPLHSTPTLAPPSPAKPARWLSHVTTAIPASPETGIDCTIGPTPPPVGLWLSARERLRLYRRHRTTRFAPPPRQSADSEHPNRPNTSVPSRTPRQMLTTTLRLRSLGIDRVAPTRSATSGDARSRQGYRPGDIAHGPQTRLPAGINPRR